MPMKLNFSLLTGVAAWLALLCLGNTAAMAAATGTGVFFKGPVGLQLYSLRDQFNKDTVHTLDEVKRMGVRFVELAGTYKLTPEQFKAELDARSLKAISGHFGYERFRDDPDGIAREAKTLGLRYVGCAWIPHNGDFNEKTCREAIAVFNRAGEILGRQGLRFFYHVHGYEFQPFENSTLLDLLMNETNPKYVTFEMDIFWIVHPGQDPVKLLEKYGSRWELMHLKDMKKGTQTGLLTGGSDVNNDVALGSGQIGLPAVLRAAKLNHVKWYFIEDESPVSERQIPESLKFLETVKW
jgi:sugar phosphate isomerase/epimerase